MTGAKTVNANSAAAYGCQRRSHCRDCGSSMTNKSVAGARSAIEYFESNPMPIQNQTPHQAPVRPPTTPPPGARATAHQRTLKKIELGSPCGDQERIWRHDQACRKKERQDL